MAAPLVLPLKEFRRLDLNSAEAGVPVLRLMDNAGKALAQAVSDMRPKGKVVFLCGKGNNGGDGYAAALHLLDTGLDVHCVVVEPPAGAESRTYHERLAAERVEAWSKYKRRRNRDIGLIVDCLLGSGMQGDPRPPYDAVIDWIGRQNAPVVSCDVPSGLGATPAVRPDATVTFHAVKEGMEKANAGKITVADIGIPKRASRNIGLGDLVVGYPVPGLESHKGQNGRVLIVGGGPFTGAPHFAGIAAYRTGADLVHLYAPEAAAKVIQSWGPDLLVHPAGLGDHLSLEAARNIATRFGSADVLLVGPGIGTHPETRDAVAWLLDDAAKVGVPVVIDADALVAVGPEYLRQHGRHTVLTPHHGEFQDLTGKKATQRNVQDYASRHNVTVLRKGKVDIVSDGTRTRQSHHGHPTMTVGGTGDVLAGCTAALLAKGATPFDAACAAAYLVGVAGEIAAETWSYGATATDVALAIPHVLHRLS